MSLRVCCVGDSNTRGQFGVSYVAMLARRIREIATVEAHGVNGDCAFNVLMRLTPIIDAQPDVVTLMIGTNDAWGTLSDANAKTMMKRKNLPDRPSARDFELHLRQIVTRLRAETNARVILISPPVLGQDPTSGAFHASAEMGARTREVASEFQLAYLPLHENQVAVLKSAGAAALPFPEGLRERVTSVLQHLILRRSYDSIANGRKLLLTADFIHQNSRGAEMITDLIEVAVRSNEEGRPPSRTSQR